MPHCDAAPRVFGKLAVNPWVLHLMLAGLGSGVQKIYPGFAEIQAVDSTGVPAYCNPNNDKTRDKGVAWGKVHAPRFKELEGTVCIYGWKAHAVVDAHAGLPAAFNISPANENVSPFLRKLLSWRKENYDWFDPATFMANNGYDGRENVKAIHNLGAAPVIPHIEHRNRSKSSIHTLKGELICFRRQGNVVLDVVALGPLGGVDK